MRYATLKAPKSTRQIVDVFRGYNHNFRISDGEFYDMENLCSDEYPLLTPRKPRGIYTKTTAPMGMVSKNELCYVDGTEFVIGKNRYDMGLSGNAAQKEMISMGAYVIILPDKKYINTSDPADRGSIDNDTYSQQSVRFQMCDATGQGYEGAIVSKTAPENPEDLQYWMFQQYRDQYTRAGQTAMQDTMGKAAQLTGGYGNSYAQQAGQQTYNTYMQGLTDKIPELYSLALQAYNNQGNDLKDRYSLLGTADNQDYGRYRDSVSDYNTELDRLTNEYNTERSYDYGQYRDNMTDAQQRWTNAWTLYQRGYKTPEILEILGLPEDGGKTGGGGGGHSSGSGKKGTGSVDLATEAAKIASTYGGSAAYKYINDQLGGKTTSAEANKAKQAAINAAAKANKRY